MGADIVLSMVSPAFFNLECVDARCPRERDRKREREIERERDRERESFNRKQKLTAIFRNNTDEAYKVNRLYIILIIV